MASRFSKDGSGRCRPLVCVAVPIERLWTCVFASGSRLSSSAIPNNAAAGILGAWIHIAGDTHGVAITTDCLEWVSADGSCGMDYLPGRLSLVQNLQATSSSMPGLIPVAETPSPEQHLGAVRIAYVSGLIVSSKLHVAVISLSAMTVISPFLYRAEYVRAFSPKAIFLPPISWTPVASLGEGVRSFLLWDQVFAYATMIFLALLQLVRVAPKLVERIGVLRMVVLVLVAITVAGPGSACILLNWAADESLLYHDLALADGEARSNISKTKAVN